MRMKNRFSKRARTWLYAMCFLSICGVSYSCSDDYDLDETLPSDMASGGIYDQLKERGFTTMVRLIDDNNYANVLSKTGSKTIFAADDEAWARFFATTNWTDGNGNPIRSYDQLSTGQKSLLFKNAMLDNAYVLEMLANVTLNNTLTKNQCLRQVTSYSAVDTIPLWEPTDLPVMLNKVPESTGSSSSVTSDIEWWGKDYWGMRNQPGSRRIFMAVDGTNGMMTHFIEANMKEKSITHSDAGFILLGDRNAWPENEERSYIYNRQIIDEDIVCKNGYIHVLDDVLVPPTNMAETIRQDPELSYFSSMLDRFSAPYYDATLTANYRALRDISAEAAGAGNFVADSIFVKLYASENGRTLGSYSPSGQLALTPDNATLSAQFPKLLFDPGWNQYSPSSTAVVKEQDMAAMFVPNNEALWSYFTTGGGVSIIERFGTDLPLTRDNFVENISQIPLNIIKSLVSNLMKNSFVETVPSKWRTIMNDAQDQMFPPSDYSDETYYQQFDKVLLANNGVIYVMNHVIAPADYASVIGPALLSEDAKVMNALLTADESAGVEGSSSFANSPLQKYYSIYLKAMQSHFSLFIPTDDALEKYGLVDPFAYSTGLSSASNWRFWSFTYKKTNMSGKVIPVEATAYLWKPEQARDISNTTALRGFRVTNTQMTNSQFGAVRANLLSEMVDQHIIVHNANETDGVLSAPNWYLSRNGAPVFVQKKVSADYGAGMEVLGGLQIWLNSDASVDNDEICTVTKGFDQTGVQSDGSAGYGNGMSYMIDRPMQPTIHSVYHMLKDRENYSTFFSLCTNSELTDILDNCGFKYLKPDSTMANAEWERERRKYLIFRPTETASNVAYYTPNGEQLVRFFNNYNYTIYLPTNSAIAEAVAKGLPTWDDIKVLTDEIKLLTETIDAKDSDDPTRADLVDQRWEKMQKAQAMVTCLLNFLKYHFQDKSLFVDNVTDEEAYQTSCIDSETNNYITLNVSRQPGRIAVTDNSGSTVTVDTSDPAEYNVLANDMQYNVQNNRNTNSVYGMVKVNSYVVMHRLAGDAYLNFLSSSSGRYDTQWATTEAARRFVKKYRIRK